MTATATNRLVKFLRSYGPIPTNDNMYDEGIQRALKREKIQPLTLPSSYLNELLQNFQSETPSSVILTGTAGDGKTYLCRQVWSALGGNEQTWLEGDHIQRLATARFELVVVKDLSELSRDASLELLTAMASQVVGGTGARAYLIAANHGQLLDKLKEAAADDAVKTMLDLVEEQLLSVNPHADVRLKVRNLSQNPDTSLIIDIIDQIVGHPGWADCAQCPIHASGAPCPILENRARLSGTGDKGILRTRLQALITVSTLNGQHFPIRQLLVLVSNALLGHPDVRDRLMTCSDVPKILTKETGSKASVYRNVFGENLPSRLADKTEVFRKLNAFGIGAETSNAADNLLVYGADDPDLKQQYEDLVLNDAVYGGTPQYARAQQAYLESYDPDAKAEFLQLLRGQRQRLFFTLPTNQEIDFDLWGLTVFRYAGRYLKMFTEVHNATKIDRKGMSLLLRGLNRLFTGMLVQNEDDLFLATSGSLSQSKRSPLLDDRISVAKSRGEEIGLVKLANTKIGVKVSFVKSGTPLPQTLELTPTRYEFLGRVAEGALPSSFSLECQEDLLAFKARLLTATDQRRRLDHEDDSESTEIVLSFIKVGNEGTADARRVSVKE